MRINIKTIVNKYGIGLFFYLMAFLCFTATGDVYILVNFIYIGTVVVGGLYLYFKPEKKNKELARNVIRIGVGMYMLFIVMFLWKENVQMEAFILNFLFILGGNFSVFVTGSVIHYLVAKTVGVIVIGRNWCGWACWYPAVFELLPYKLSKGRHKNMQIIPYINLIITTSIAVFIFFSHTFQVMYNSSVFIFALISVAIYYCVGLVMTVLLKDNRAVCKYFCPVPIFQRVFMPFTLCFVKVNKIRCVDCRQCEKVCNMDIKITEYIKNGSDITSPSCIQCRKCVENCKKGALSLGYGKKRGKTKEYLNYIK